MAVAKIRDLRSFSRAELSKKLDAYRREMLEVGENPKKQVNLRKAIARVLTILNEKVPAAEKPAKGDGKKVK